MYFLMYEIIPILKNHYINYISYVNIYFFKIF